MTADRAVRVDVHLAPERPRATRSRPTCAPASPRPRRSCRRSGSTTTAARELFDEITRLPEYYPTRAERAILAAHAAEIAAAHRRRHARRARLGHVGEDAPAARRARATPARSALRAVRRQRADAARRGRGDRRRVPGHRGARGRRRLRAPPRRSCPAAAAALVAFLGSTIGNLAPGPRARVPRRARRRPRTRRRAAARHRPREGRRPARGGLRRRRRRHRRVQPQRAARRQPRARRRLRPRARSTTSPAATPTHEWIEMRLRADARPARARRGASTSTVEFAAGEEMRTEISAKFRRERRRGRARRRRPRARRVVDRPGRRLRPQPGPSGLIPAAELRVNFHYGDRGITMDMARR